jgi:membrane protease YdiL (CAAX protease family)
MPLDPRDPKDPSGPQDPLARHGPALAGVLLALVLSVMTAAVIGGMSPGDYHDRATVYTVLVVWLVVGAVVVFLRAAAGERSRLSIRRVLLWAVSIWLWPLIAIGNRSNRD